MSKVSEHLANVVAMIEQIGTDAEHLTDRFAGDVEGHLRVVESHLMEIINAAKPTKVSKADAKAAADAAAKEAADQAAAELAAQEAADKAAADAKAEADAKAAADAAAASQSASKTS